MSNASDWQTEELEADLVPFQLPKHLLANFEKAEQQLHEIYKVTPGVPALVRLWLSCGTSSRIRREFELAVLDIRMAGTLDRSEVDGDNV
jgi:hypothetical protein